MGSEMCIRDSCGDGSLQMQQMELATLCQEGLDIKLIVLDNRSLGMVRELQQTQYDGRLSAVELRGGPDFIKLAEAYALPGLRLDEETQTDKAIRWLLESTGPRLLCCTIDPQEPSILHASGSLEKEKVQGPLS